VWQTASGFYYRLSEDDKKIIATTSWIEFRDFLVVIDANFPWGAKALLLDLKKTSSKPIPFVLDTHYHGDHHKPQASLRMSDHEQILCSSAYALHGLL
jgi:glyoxylase-like metal-dependent hydrolase (beta-lactamase superfamily II)